MNDFYIALVIGIVAGIIDVTPMIIQKIDRHASLSAFCHWVVLGLIIPFVDWDMQPWFKGIVIALLSVIPIMIVVYPQDKKALIPMVVFSIILGAGVGLAGARYIG
jgi:hypothetical protein